jgi:glutathione S-transferase
VKLYSFPVAPNPTRVRLYLAEKAEAGSPIPLEEISVNLREGEQRGPEHLARNPFGKLPVLELDDGRALTESLAIIEYLEELYPQPALIGREPFERARVRELERICEIGVLHPVAFAIHATRSPLGLPPDPPLAAHSLARLPQPLAVLETGLSDGRPFLAGERPTIADCTLAAALQFGRIFELPMALGDLVTRWDAAYRARGPAMAVLVG